MTSFGPLTLTGGTLLRDGRPVVVGQRAMALLEALVTADGPVDKAALMEAAWPGTVVEEGNLSVQIAALRKALGTRPDGSEWIVTVPRVGYRLVRGDPLESRQDSRAASIAVLPFQNLSGDPEQDYFADGIVEDITTALSRFRALSVVARNSSFVYKGRAVDVREVARNLDVRYVLEGSVRRAGQRLRVAAQLVDGESGAHVWARNFDGDLADVFEVQDRITEAVAGVVYPKLEQAEIERARRKPPGNLDAYDLTLRGRQLYWRVREQENAEAMRLFMRALELDPDYGEALSSAAAAMEFRVTIDWPPLTADDRAYCLDLIERALQAADGDAIILAHAGVTLANNYRQYERGLRLVDRAIEANPNAVMALGAASVAYLHCADVHQAIAFAKRAIDLSPSDPAQHWALTAISHAHMALGEFDEALAWAERSLGINPDFDCTYWMLIAANAQLDRVEEAHRWLRVFRGQRPDVTVGSIRRSQPSRYPDRMAAILEGLRFAGLPE